MTVHLLLAHRHRNGCLMIEMTKRRFPVHLVQAVGKPEKQIEGKQNQRCQKAGWVAIVGAHDSEYPCVGEIEDKN